MIVKITIITPVSGVGLDRFEFSQLVELHRSFLHRHCFQPTLLLLGFLHRRRLQYFANAVPPPAAPPDTVAVVAMVPVAPAL